jgi:drug/metabolite transporter (DMT)-like permease
MAMIAEWVSMAVVVIAWGVYPLVIRSTGVSGPVGALILTVSALVPIGVALGVQGGFTRPSMPDLVRLVVSGVIMGAGTTAFNFLVNSRKLEASVAIPIVDMGMLLVTTFGAVWFYSEPVTLRKVVGIGLLIAGIGVLRPG